MELNLLGKPGYIVIQALITGLLVGGIYGLIALGIVIINKASGVFNFAHGLMMLIGGLIFWSLFQTQPLSPMVAFILSGVVLTLLVTGVRWPVSWSRQRVIAAILVAWLITGYALIQQDNVLIRALIGTALGAALMGLLIERLAIRPLIGQPLFTTVMMTLAVSEVLLGVTQITWGSVDRALPVFATTNALGLPQEFEPIRIQNLMGGTVVIKLELLIAFVLAMTAFVLFVLFFNYTSLGLSMRATSENLDLAQAVGLRVRTILAVAWAVAGVLAATAGVLHGGSTGVSLTMPGLALRAFPAVLLGGLESVTGAIIGGLIIGVTEKLGTALFSSDVGEQLLPFVVLMVVLVIRPSGLFGERRIERI
jgi:branched-chain amino acid transport system permease protein